MNNINHVKIVLILMTLLSGGTGMAENNAANNAALFLQIDPSPVASGSAGTILKASADSIFWNPAGLGFLESLEISVSGSSWFQGMGISTFSAGMTVPKLGSFGIGFTGFFYGKIPSIAETLSELVEDGTLKANDTAFFAGYASLLPFIKAFPVSAGLSAKIVAQSLADINATALAFDTSLGTRTGIFKPKDVNVKVQVSAGLLVRNIGMNLKFVDQSFSLPLATETILNSRIFYPGGDSSIVAIRTGYVFKEGFKFNIGLEYAFKETAFIRLGFKPVEELNKVTLGAGVRTMLMGRPFSADYSIEPFGALGMTHRFGLTTSLDPEYKTIFPDHN